MSTIEKLEFESKFFAAVLYAISESCVDILDVNQRSELADRIIAELRSRELFDILSEAEHAKEVRSFTEAANRLANELHMERMRRGEHSAESPQAGASP